MTKINLTDNQLSELKYHLANRITDNMDVKQLVQIAFDSYHDYFDRLSEVEFLETAKNYWNDSFDEVVEEIKEYADCDFKKPIEDRDPSNFNIGELE